MRLLLTAAALLFAAAPAQGRGRMVHGVAATALAQAARQTQVADVDYDQDRCDPRTVDQWLHALADSQARKIEWSGGPCGIVGSGIDSGSRWCARAVVQLRHPASPDDRPAVEVFFEEPVAGRPGKAYAFRGRMKAADGEDITRFRKDFEADWTSRFPPPAGVIVDCPASD